MKLRNFNKIKTMKPRSKLISKWMISYISVLLLPLLICSFYYFHTYKVIKTENNANQHLLLGNTREQIDNVFTNLMGISANLQFNKYIKSLSYKNRNPISSATLQQYYLKNDLTISKVTNTLIDEISIYFPKSGYIVSSDTVYKKSLIKHMPSSYITEATWETLYKTLNTADCQLLAPKDSNYLLFAKALVTDSTQKPLSIIAFQLNKDALCDLLSNNLLTDKTGALAIIHKDSILLSTNDRITAPLDFASISIPFYDTARKQDIISIQNKNLPKESYVIDFYQSILPKIGFLSITESSIYNNHIYTLFEILFITLILSVTIGLFITYLYSKRNYRPIEQIMKSIGDTKFDSLETNEYNIIMKKLLRNNTEIEKQRILLRNNYLNKILTGEIQINQISGSIAEQFKLNFTSQYSHVIILRISKGEEDNSPNQEAEELTSSYHLIHFIIQNILQELLSNICPKLNFCFLHSQIAVIINIPDEIQEIETILTDHIQTLLEFCDKFYQISFQVGISGKCENKNLSDAFSQANNALEYLMLFENGTIYSHEDLLRQPEIGYIHLNTSDYVTNLVLNATGSQLEEYFKKIQEELSAKTFSTYDAKSCLYFFYRTTMQIKLLLFQQYHNNLPSDINFINSSFFQYSLKEAMIIVEEKYHVINDFVQNQKIMGNNKLVEDVCHYIESNYFDTNLNLNNIAEHFHFSPSYLSKKFRSEMTKSIVDYLYEIRINNSLKLISDTALKISDIALMSGFQDSNAFIRIFKKYIGTTPGRYKEGC